MKEAVVYIYIYIKWNNIQPSKNMKSCPFMGIMDGLWGQYTKWTETDRQRQIFYDLTSGDKKNFYPLPSQTHGTRDYIVLTRDGRLGEREVDEGSQKVQTPSYKYWGYKKQHDDHS